jgi:crotonobetainyl-CoA:carnitine CoA-transferase CaiB-like acyl-CoA transferase
MQEYLKRKSKNWFSASLSIGDNESGFRVLFHRVIRTEYGRLIVLVTNQHWKKLSPDMHMSLTVKKKKYSERVEKTTHWQSLDWEFFTRIE